MTRQPLPGIDGVLDNLLSTGPTHAGFHVKSDSQPMKDQITLGGTESTTGPRKGARRGRPMGAHRHQGVTKEKVTFRISCELVTAYRNWSWEARCPLSTLIEKALRAYHRQRVKSTACRKAQPSPSHSFQNDV